MEANLLKHIMRVDDLIRLIEAEEAPLALKTECARAEQEAVRSAVREGRLAALPAEEEMRRSLLRRLQRAQQPSLRPVVNATGVVLHTNLGRACLSRQAAEAAAAAAGRYSTLEYDLESGERGSRHSHVEKLLCAITGAEAGMVVNNNAAAVLLLLSCIAPGREVVTSRGELVEIGGSFRVPEIMEACGAVLREVGTTNRTKAADYENAVGENTAALMKVHPSNFRMVGFTECPERSEIVQIAHRHGLLAVEDLGSGALLEPAALGFHEEPSVFASVRAGMDVVTFSGDKLMGGPQAGILIGKKACIEKLKKHPLARAVRVDKMTLAALEATLTAYKNGTAKEELPVIKMLTAAPYALKERASRLAAGLHALGYAAEVIEESDMVGGGSVPGQELFGFAVALEKEGMSGAELEKRLRGASTPVICRVNKGRVQLHTRTLLEGDEALILQAAKEALA